jgi:hypothetical protein
MVKKFIQRRYVRKMLRSSLARPSRLVVTTAPSSGGSLSSPTSLALGVREAPAVEKAPPARTSAPVPSLRKEENLAVAPAANLISVPPTDCASMGVDLIMLSSDSEDEVN